MENEEELSNKRLEDLTYRQLQHMAKSMHLPSNYKKVYLIELIKARKFKTELDVCRIIDKAKQERLQSKGKKKSRINKMKICEAKSSIEYSPQITVTPKRSSKRNLRYSPGSLKTDNLNPRSLLRKNNPISQNASNTTTSDRILRSYNLRNMKPNYDIINNNLQICESQYNIIPTNDFSQFNVTVENREKKKDVNLFTGNTTPAKKHQLMLRNDVEMDGLQNPVEAKRQKTVSGIYPLVPVASIPKNLTTNNTICLRKIKCGYKKINALVQKCNVNLVPLLKKHQRKPKITLQDIINDSVAGNLSDNIINKNTSNNDLRTQYPNVSDTDIISNNTVNVTDTQMALVNNYEVALCEKSSIYYGQIDTNEHVNHQKIMDVQVCERLPNINDAFIKYLHKINLPQLMCEPMSQVSSELDSGINLTCATLSNADTMLETHYNLKIISSIFQLPAKPANTDCVYSTRTVVTASVLPSTVNTANDWLMASPAPDGFIFDMNIHFKDEFFQVQTAIEDIHYKNEVLNSSPLDSLDANPKMNATPDEIAEMVEDALEIISQDRDYLEQMGLNMRVQCALCSWAGPQIVLEWHVRKEHIDVIDPQVKTEWNITYTLESLVNCRVWLNRIIEYNSTLYILSAKYEDPGCLMATLSSLSTEPEPTENIITITIYNKITGEPFSWRGQIPVLPPNLPYENSSDCLKIDLAKLDLLPNSANLKLINRELVTDSPSKVVVGQPALNDIHIILFIKIFN